MTAPLELYANSAATTLANGINAAATTIVVAAATGSVFPNPIVGQQVFRATLIDNATGLIKEIVLCTARSGDTLTVVRGQEGTAAVSWNAGDQIKQLVTAGVMQNLIQIPQAQAQSYKFAQDTGSVNSVLVALSPAVTTRIPGLEINVRIAANNNGPSTLNLGAGSVQIVNPDGSDLGSGALVAGGVATFIDTGSGPYQLISASQELQSGSGLATTGGFQWRPTAETLTGWVIAQGGQIGNASSGAALRANADCANLFAWHWNLFSNTQCPVFDSSGNPVSRGANAAADFAANRRIQVIDMRGTGIAAVDANGSTFWASVPIVSGSGSPGSVLGANMQTLSAGHIPTITSGGNNFISVATTLGSVGFSPQSSSTGGGGFGFFFPGSYGQITSNGSVSIAVTSTNTGPTAHNNTERMMLGNFWIKL